MKRALLFTLCIMWLATTTAVPDIQEKFYFTQLEVDHGLTQNTVWCILQDHMGFMWFGTKDGLNRYDGYKFRTFRHKRNDPYALGCNFIRSLYEDDKGILWIGSDIGLHTYDPKTERFSRFMAKTPDNISINREVTDIRCDRSGILWICVNWQGLFRYDPANGSLKLYTHNAQDSTSLSSSKVWTICFDAEDNVWVGTHGGGLNYLDRESDIFHHYSIGNNADIYKIVQDGQGQLLIGTANAGVYKFNPHTRTTAPLIENETYHHLFVRDIFVKNNSEIWIGTESGIYIYNYRTRQVRNIREKVTDRYSLSCNAVYCIYRDKEDALWIGTYFGGVNYLPTRTTHFDKYYPTGDDNWISGKAVREFVQDDNGYIWIGTEDAGLNCFDPRSDTFLQFNSHNSGLTYDNIHGLCVDGNQLYIGTYNGGFHVMDLRTHRIVNYKKHSGQGSISDNNVFSIYKDQQGHIWVGTIYGLNLFDKRKGTFRLVSEINPQAFIYDIFQGDNGIIYFAVYNEGVYAHNPYNNSWELIGPEHLKRALHQVITIDGDSRSNIWFGTERGGVICYTPSSNTWKYYTDREGLPNNVIYKILEDNNRNIWMSTNKGLARLNTISETFSIYTSKNGLPSDQFNYKSGFRTDDGKLYFGTIDGFIGFYPERFLFNNNIPPVVLTGFSFPDGSPHIGEKRSPLQQSPTYTSKIILSYDQSTFSIDFATLSYNASNRNQYRYIMENYSPHWTLLNSNQTVTYSKVPPGKYVFRVMGANCDGVWNEEGVRLEIEIRPPFYRSTTAYIFYALVLSSTGWYYNRKTRKKIRRRLLYQAEQTKINRERAVYQAKIDFFTNITHEIRTPLSLIKGPFEQIIKPDISPDEYQENISIMEMNIHRLLNLTNQLLDFRKVETESFSIHRTQTNIETLIDQCCRQFTQIIRQKKLELKTVLPNQAITIDIDREAFIKIVCNLLDNAIKYAAKHITVELLPSSMKQPWLILRIWNDGEPIDKRYREKIFEPFFQIKSNYRSNTGGGTGTGLGLSLIKHLIELHNGHIYLDSETETGGGTCFIVEIPQITPVNDEHLCVERPTDTTTDRVDPSMDTDSYESDSSSLERHHIENSHTKTLDETTESPTILIVEDDTSLRIFLNNLLSPHYRIIRAENGQEALNIIDQENIDLILTDLMMPVMDGFELCSFLKSHLEYSHIPIVILSAKTDMGSKITGLESGADAYIEKPFSGDYLMAQITTILSNRQIAKETFSRMPFVKVHSVATSSSDKIFLDTLTHMIEENLVDENFCIDDLARMMNMSRSSLHRKMKGILQMTPNDFIRVIRLKKAAEMLAEGNYRVNEICFMVGFSSPSYFSKCFQKQYGVLPKNFIQ